MKVLLLGSGGREHALAWKIAQSPLLTQLYGAPGNPGIAQFASLVDLNIHDNDAVAEFCINFDIDLVVVGPEAPLVAGLVDRLQQQSIAVFGPNAKAAQLEGSKGFSKDLCARFHIPTAAYQRFHDAGAAKTYLQEATLPIVIKADGLAAGKGVVIAQTLEQAYTAVDACFNGAFGEAGSEVVIEEFLEGEEVSFFCICDRDKAIPFGSAQDHKRVGDGDCGPNTGGMGAYAPAPIMTDAIQAQVMRDIVEPLMQGMKEIGTPFSGILFVGLMITKTGPQVIEYNVRFGDPECQVLMALLKSDILELLTASATATLNDKKVVLKQGAALTVVMAAQGYPESYKKGGVITGIERAEAMSGIRVFQAGTTLKDGALVANGGRVLNVTALAETVELAQAKAYEAIQKIHWTEGFYRHDIGWRALNRNQS